MRDTKASTRTIIEREKESTTGLVGRGTVGIGKKTKSAGKGNEQPLRASQLGQSGRTTTS